MSKIYFEPSLLFFLTKYSSLGEPLSGRGGEVGGRRAAPRKACPRCPLQGPISLTTQYDKIAHYINVNKVINYDKTKLSYHKLQT